jgi:hypothetical protein
LGGLNKATRKKSRNEEEESSPGHSTIIYATITTTLRELGKRGLYQCFLINASPMHSANIALPKILRERGQIGPDCNQTRGVFYI